MSDHTPTPWAVDDDTHIVGPDGSPILVNADDLEPGMRGEFYYAKDARQAVAAVNATAGIPTEALEAGVIPQLVEAAQEVWVEVGCLEPGPDLRTCAADHPVPCAVCRLKAALASVKGKDDA